MNLSKTFSLAVTDNPVKELESMVFIFGISGGSQPIDDDGNNSESYSCGNTKRKISRVCEERTSESQTEVGQIET